MIMENVSFLSTSMDDVDKTEKSQAHNKIPYFDVCIVCATPQEAETTMSVISLHSQVFFQKTLNHWGNEYYYANIYNCNDEELSVHISWLLNYGPATVAPHLQTIISMFKPRFVALTGVCAGDKKKSKLGDLAIARSAFFYDDVNTEENGSQIDLYSTNLDIHYILATIDAWEKDLVTLKRFLAQTPLTQISNKATFNQPFMNTPGIQEDNLSPDTDFPPKFHIAPMASTTAVRRDNPFNKVQALVPATIAIDMEGAAFYRTIMQFPGISSLVVKGICDYADNDKDDTYRFYASATSATYILSFIKKHVTPYALL